MAPCGQGSGKGESWQPAPIHDVLPGWERLNTLEPEPHLFMPRPSRLQCHGALELPRDEDGSDPSRTASRQWVGEPTVLNAKPIASV